MPQVHYSSAAADRYDVAFSLQPDQSSAPLTRWERFSLPLCPSCLSARGCEKGWRDIDWCYHLLNSSSVVVLERTGQVHRRASAEMRTAAPVPQMVSQILDVIGISKTQLAEILSLTRQAIYGWLKGAEPSTAHFERVSVLAGLVEEICQDTRRPLYQGFVFSSIQEGRPSLLELLRLKTWDLAALRSALSDARHLTSERDRKAMLERRRLESFRQLREDEQLQNLEDNLLSLE